MEELHGEEGQQESQEQLELPERHKNRIQPYFKLGIDWCCRHNHPDPVPDVSIGAELLRAARSLKPFSASDVPVVRAEGGGTVAEPPVQQRAVLRQQVWVRGAGRLRVARGGEHGAVGRRRGGGLSCHLLVGW